MGVLWVVRPPSSGQKVDCVIVVICCEYCCCGHPDLPIICNTWNLDPEHGCSVFRGFSGKNRVRIPLFFFGWASPLGVKNRVKTPQNWSYLNFW